MTGNEYFNILATRSFFQDFEKYDDSGIKSCKVHDIIHVFAQYLTQNKCYTLEVNGHEEPRVHSSYEKAHHAMIVLDKRASFQTSYIKSKALRSLLVETHRLNVLTSRQLDQLICLRAMKWESKYIIGAPTVQIPEEIKKLIHLRYLGIPRNGVRELPETLCKLYNLQTLDVSLCLRLEKLPRGIGMLTNLRHLLLYVSTERFSYMPKGIDRLICLRSLSLFVVSDSNHADGACTLEGLKYLKHLHGSLMIKRLGNVRDVSQAKKAELQNKTKLTGLHLNFEESDKDEEGTRAVEDDEQLLETLQPPCSLQTLDICKFRGKVIPSIWLMSLSQLRKLYPNNCMNFEFLPPLGNLPSLELINLRSMKKVKRVGKEFLSVESDIGASSSSSSSSSVTAFSKLTSLCFDYLPEWEEWDYDIKVKDDQGIMPNLDSLSIHGCAKLQALPDHLFQNPSLKKLKIWDCPLLYSYLKTRGQNWPKNFHIPEIEIRLCDEDSGLLQYYNSSIDQKEHNFKMICTRQVL